jgi:hypothetical protein
VPFRILGHRLTYQLCRRSLLLGGQSLETAVVVRVEIDGRFLQMPDTYGSAVSSVWQVGRSTGLLALRVGRRGRIGRALA